VTDVDLDDLVPCPEHVTHRSRVIAAPASVVWEELEGLRPTSLPVTLVLAGIRFLSVLHTTRGRRRLTDRTFAELVPMPVLSLEPGAAMVFGGLLQPWRLTGGQKPPVLDATELRGWSEPGWAKAAMEFRLTEGPEGTTLRTETRVTTTDPRSRKRFTRYWTFVRAGSSAIRWEVLAAVARRAEARAPRGRPGP
jgi:hypothetical protein